MMITKTYPITEQLIINGLALTEQLFQLLTAESRVLKYSKKAAQINHTAIQKQQLVVQLNDFAQQLAKILATAQQTNTPEGIEKYFSSARAAHLDTAKTLRNWAELTHLSKKCRHLNEQNGAAIELLSRHTQRALHIIKGKPQTVSTYGPDGSTNGEMYSRPLISV